VRVLITADPFLPVPPLRYGGIERIVAGLAEGLRGLGVEVGLLAHRDSAQPVDWFAPWPGASAPDAPGPIRHMRAMTRAVAAFEPDLVHSYSRLAYLAGVLPRRLAKLMSYQRHPSRRTVAAARLLAGGTLQFTGCSAHIATLGRRGGGTWHAIPNFVDTDRFRHSAVVTPDAPAVFLSRVESIKGAHLAIEMARRAGRRLLIAGNLPEAGHELEYARSLVMPWFGRDGIEYVGEVDDAAKVELLGSALCLLVPIQWNEPFGIVFAEALACGTPIVSCPRGALPEIVQAGYNGFLVESIEDGVAALARVPSLSRAACRESAERNYSRQVVVPQYASLYRRMLPHAR